MLLTFNYNLNKDLIFFPYSPENKVCTYTDCHIVYLCTIMRAIMKQCIVLLYYTLLFQLNKKNLKWWS